MLFFLEMDLARALKETIDAGDLAGAAALVFRGDQVISSAVAGFRDVAAGLPIERDTLFRIASLTKPITHAAALLLLEEGRFALNDPITRFAPEFAEMRVLRSPSGALTDHVPAKRVITFDDLLTHRSGITYGAFHPGPLAKAFADALGGDIDTHVAPDQWIAALAKLPLIDQPGASFHYGHSTDLLGLLIARIEDAPLGDVLKRRIFTPLGMKDTSFIVPREKWQRRAGLYGFDGGGRLIPRQTGPGGSTVAERPDDMLFVSGGQGLWSTLDDYLAFAKMFIGRASLLKPETLRMMMTNQLTADQRARSEMFGMPIFAKGHGYGMGVAVVIEPEHAVHTLCGGHEGTVGWPGGFGGWWQADPQDSSVAIFLTHNIVELEQLADGVGLGVYAAISKIHALASSR